MKKVLCALAASVIGFSAFAEGKGGLSFTLDTRAAWDSENGFNIGAGEDDFYLEFLCNYETSIGGAMFRLRNTLDSDTQWLKMDRWEGWIKPVDFLKVSMGSQPVELYAEGVKWDAIAGAGIFESAGNHLYLEAYPVDGLTIGAGLLQPTAKSHDDTDDDGEPDTWTEHSDAKKPYKALAAWATYNIACVGNVSLTYEAMGSPIAWEKQYDGDIKRIGAIFDYNGIDNFEVIAAYAGLIAKDDEDKTKLAQSRIDLDLHYTAEQYFVELFNSVVLRDFGDGANKMGNRVGIKAEYYLTDMFTPWIRANFYKNYTGELGPMWGSAYLYDHANEETGEDLSKKWGVLVEPRLSMNLGKGITAIFGANISHATWQEKKTTWAIPVEFIVNF